MAAEQLDTFTPEIALEPEVPLVVAVPEMAGDQLVRYRAAHFIGNVLLDNTFQAEQVKTTRPIESLAQGIHLAYAGDIDGYNMVDMNASTDAIERIMKTGHVGKKVPLSVDKEGNIVQHCQLYDSVQANSLRRAAKDKVMLARTEAEARNGFRMKWFWQEGLFEDYSLVVFSPAENRKGFFTETMSLSIQVTSKHGDGLATEPAFVSGIAAPGHERHDLATIASVGEKLDVDLANKTPAEIIDTPILIHNSLIPNGVIDVVKMLDDVNGTFFGEYKPSQDYIAYLGACRRREETFKDKFDLITRELIAEAPNIYTPSDAVNMLDKISEKHMVEKAIVDKSIDVMVFGSESAYYIEQSRMAYQNGDLELLENHRQKAIDTADSYSCPSAGKPNRDRKSGQEGDDSEEGGSDKYGSLNFKCPKGHKNTRLKNTLIPRCTTCGISVRC